MTVAAIVATLAKEFSIQEAEAQTVSEAFRAGLKAPYLARYRRAETGALTEGLLRRFDRRRRQLEELGRRRESLIKTLLGAKELSEEELAAKRAELEKDTEFRRVFTCMDPRELEDLFLPHRKPEPEVQLALDRGLGPLVDDLLAARAPSQEATTNDGPEAAAETPADGAQEADVSASPVAVAEVATETATEITESAEAPSDPATEAVVGEAAPTPSDASASPQAANGEVEAPAVASAPELDVETPVAQGSAEGGQDPKAEEAASLRTKVEFTPELARLCQPFVNTDRGVHSDQQALEGAMRVLSDRLGRSPEVRSLVRRLAKKHGQISVRALADEKKLGRHKSLLKIRSTLKQLQGHKLLGLRQAQMHRLVAVAIEFDPKVAHAKVRNLIGKRIHPDVRSVVDVVVAQAVEQRILPMIEEDIRAELRERAEDEALRFLAQHLRMILLAPPGVRRVVAGVDVNAKGDWTIAVLDVRGNVISEEIKLELADKKPAEIAAILGKSLGDHGVQSIAVGHGKGSREAINRLREAIHLLGVDAQVYVVNEAGLASYANSELARSELPNLSVPARMAVSLGRRFQNPLSELLKTDSRHLGLGRETSVISKAGLRRLLHDTVESCVAHVGCDVNEASLGQLRYVPGLDFELAKKIVARREERPFTSREELKELLEEPRWTNAIGFLRIAGAQEPLDRTHIHPTLYELARKVLTSQGGSVESMLGQRDATKGLRRSDFEIDEATWRELLREASHPGRDPRLRLFPPQLLPPDTDPATLEKGRVLEGIVSNVASFGVFVDLGIPRDGMIHISEASERYVRDARGLLSIGQLVRGRVLDPTGQRVELSLKKVPSEPRRRTGRPGGPAGGPRGAQGSGGERRERGRPSGAAGKQAWPEFQPVTRAARTRRDGLAGASAGRSGGRGGGGGGRPGGGRNDGRRKGRDKDDSYDAAAVRDAKAAAGSYNPFASFFKKGEKKSEDS